MRKLILFIAAVLKAYLGDMEKVTCAEFDGCSKPHQGRFMRLNHRHSFSGSCLGAWLAAYSYISTGIITPINPYFAARAQAA
jgi:hypothetical protein